MRSRVVFLRWKVLPGTSFRPWSLWLKHTEYLPKVLSSLGKFLRWKRDSSGLCYGQWLTALKLRQPSTEFSDVAIKICSLIKDFYFCVLWHEDNSSRSLSPASCKASMEWICWSNASHFLLLLAFFPKCILLPSFPK